MGIQASEDYGSLQKLVDILYSEKQMVSRLEVINMAEVLDMCSDLQDLVNALPPGIYPKTILCDEINSIIAARAWGFVYGTVE